MLKALEVFLKELLEFRFLLLEQIIILLSQIDKFLLVLSLPCHQVLLVDSLGVLLALVLEVVKLRN